MRKYIAQWLYPAAFRYQEDYDRKSQALYDLREQFRQCQQAQDEKTRALKAIEDLLTEGIYAARLHSLSDGTLVLLRMHYTPDSGSWEFQPFRISRGVGTPMGKLSTGVRYIDYTRPDVALYETDNRCLFIYDFKLGGESQNKGLGSYMLQALADIGRGVARVCRIEGNISYVDWDRVDQLERFYSRRGYTVELNRPDQSGTIVKWLRQPA